MDVNSEIHLRKRIMKNLNNDELIDFCWYFILSRGNLELNESAKCRLKSEFKRRANFEASDETIEWAKEEIITAVTIIESRYPNRWKVELLGPGDTNDREIFSFVVDMDDLIYTNDKGEIISLKHWHNIKDFIINYTHSYRA